MPIFEEVKIFSPEIHHDKRGTFCELYVCTEFPDEYVQDNYAMSYERNTIRGLHYQLIKPQAKLITVIQGAILDIILDIRIGSPTFGQYMSIVAAEDDNAQFFIPKGFAHGYRTLKHNTIIMYKCSDYYEPNNGYGILWHDRDLKIDWDINIGSVEIIVSDQDKKWPMLRDVPNSFLPRYEK